MQYFVCTYISTAEVVYVFVEKKKHFEACAYNFVVPHLCEVQRIIRAALAKETGKQKNASQQIKVSIITIIMRNRATWEQWHETSGWKVLC